MKTLKIWDVDFEQQASNTKEWIFSDVLVSASSAELAIEKARKSALKTTWREDDEQGNENPKGKIVRVIGFRLKGIQLKSELSFI